MPKRSLDTGSQPYDDGSGFRYDIQIRENDGDPFMWIGNNKDLHVELAEWEQLKQDVDAAIAAFKAAP